MKLTVEKRRNKDTCEKAHVCVWVNFIYWDVGDGGASGLYARLRGWCVRAEGFGTQLYCEGTREPGEHDHTGEHLEAWPLCTSLI